MKRAAIYVRVSTVDQNRDTQLMDLRQMAGQRGCEIVHEYADRISGLKGRRPALEEMMRDARRGRFDVALVWAFDRLARSVKHFLEVLDELNRLNIEFVSFREQVDTGGPLDRAVIRRDRRHGQSLGQLAHQYCVSRTTIHRVLNERPLTTTEQVA